MRPRSDGMDILKQQVRRARRRLSWQRFLSVLSWCWFGALLVAAVLIGVDKFYPLGVLPWGWVAGATGLGLLAAVIFTWATRRSELEAALEIDRRFGLKERVSSTYSLDAELLASAAGQALVDDTVRRVERLHVAEQFKLRLNRWCLAPLAPALLAFAVAVFIHPAVGENPAGGSVTDPAQRKQVKVTTNALREKLRQRRTEAREKGLKDAEQLFEKLEQGSQKLAKAQDADRKKGLLELNDLAKDLEKRKQQLGGGDKLKEQFSQLKNMQKGPGDKLADSLRKGDLKQASKELEKLKDQIKNGKLDEKAKAELAKQLEQMQQKLKQMADSHKKLEEDLKRQIAEKRSQGQSKEADELERQLAKLSQQSPQMKQLKEMAEQCGKCAKGMQEGDQAAAMEAMDQMQSQLDEMKDQLDELAMLDEAMDEISQAKDSMNCKQCDGAGCKSCQGNKQGNGNGMGRGRGTGERPEEKTDSGFYDTQVKQKLGKGAAVVTDLVEGPNIKGQVQQEIQTQFESAKTDAADPLTDQALPRGYRDHAKKYFDSFRDGK